MTTPPATPAAAFSHVGICVADLERSLRFYCDGLGFEVAEGYDLTDTLHLSLGGRYTDDARKKLLGGAEKLAKAHDLGVPILDPAGFEHLLATGELPPDN